MNLSLKNKDILNYVYLTMALIGTYWVIGVYEISMSKALGVTDAHLGQVILYKFLNDFLIGVLIGVICLPLYLIINVWSRKVATSVIALIFAVLVILQFALVKYSLTTLINLGADILGYSFDDAFNTVASSEAISFTYFLPFVIFPALLILMYIGIKKYKNDRVIAWGGLGVILVFGGLGLLLPEATAENFQNKTAYLISDIIKFKSEANRISALNFSDRSDFPLLKPFDTPDVLSPFFNSNEEKPNIVFIVVEGLGSEFVDGNDYSGFTPYLDELIGKSLYWENFVSNTGRSFGLLPSLFGSLPYGETGFLEIKDTPSHLSLINILKANGYYTSFYSGDASNFDRKVNFLDYNGIDNLIDENKYGSGFEKTKANDGGFSWGYPDGEIFKKALQSLNLEKQPRLDIIMTLTNHEPFEYPDKENYMAQVDGLINKGNKTEALKSAISSHRDIFGSLLYTDEAIKEFMEAYAKRPDYNNTIFVITGDHRLIPIAMKDKLCRYHVPLAIYSPMLKKAQKFKSVSSHWDVTPSLLSYLNQNHKFIPLKETAWMGKGLDTTKAFRNVKSIPLMRYKGDMDDIIYKEYLLTSDELYKINERFEVSKVNDKNTYKTITDSLRAFKEMNAYVTQREKIFPDSLNTYSNTKTKFTAEQLAAIDEYAKGKTFDELFIITRDLSFNKRYDRANLLCDYILNEFPNYSEARVLKGRILAWEGDYENAEKVMLNALERSPFIGDTYMALLDLYWWSGQEYKSIPVFEQAIKNEVLNPDIRFKMAMAYKRIDKPDEALVIINALIRNDPNTVEYKNFKTSLQ
ncbi:sulfatase-like hydrolase/transferase [Gelidibacter salicanalis]|uniref:Sulfatase-like hydrolase/transferase n=1 Tax=Gelidibacter salicanalis TaxID=291193 RepID=A0A934KUZ7_9FLAO|nr:sulfatase-like hydrolase/transferase [Gelidibacter salicanalis]MBJ7881831.1 sulfatase-like hydrolase/transferase [Gelidibacter salicanalis]